MASNENAVDSVKARPVGTVDLAVSQADGGAQSFYEKCEFTPTGEPYRGGRRMVLPRRGVT